MEQRRIDAIRQLGDELAGVISGGDRRLLSGLRRVNTYRDVRALLLRASTRRLQDDGELLLSFDDFLLIFEEGDEVPRIDWRLAWDLVFLRTLEQLHAAGWFRRHSDALQEIALDEEGEEDAAQAGVDRAQAALPE